MNRFDRERWDTMGKEALSRVEELMNTSRINDLIHPQRNHHRSRHRNHLQNLPDNPE